MEIEMKNLESGRMLGNDTVLYGSPAPASRIVFVSFWDNGGLVSQSFTDIENKFLEHTYLHEPEAIELELVPAVWPDRCDHNRVVARRCKSEHIVAARAGCRCRKQSVSRCIQTHSDTNNSAGRCPMMR
jgi:hypothetical protein